MYMDNSTIFYEMQQRGISPPSSNFSADGKIHRYYIKGDKAGTTNGWYVIHDFGIILAIFGSWRNGERHTWTSKSPKDLTLMEKVLFLNKKAEVYKNLDAIKSEEHQKAAEKARRLWKSYLPAKSCHPYIAKKRILPFKARQSGSDIVLPITDCDNLIHSLQYIDSRGNKYFLSGGRKKGNFILVSGDLSYKEVGIAEGFSTAATLAIEHPNMCVVAALDAGNLEPVAICIRRHNPTIKIYIFGDDDRNTDGNPGFTRGLKAAAAVKGELELPVWPIDAPEHLTDFNDLACWLEESNREVADE